MNFGLLKKKDTVSRSLSKKNKIIASFMEPDDVILDKIESIEYSYKPFNENPVRGILAFLALALFAYLAASELNSLFNGVVLFLVGFLSISSYYIRSTYKLDRIGVERRFLGLTDRREWGRFRSFYKLEGGILLSPFKGKSVLEKFRGFELPTQDNNGLIIAFIKRKFKKYE